MPPLTDLTIKKLSPKEKPFRVSDEKGLVLQVHPNGSKYWQVRYRFRGKEKLLSLGVYPELSLAGARAKRDDARKLVAEGSDPCAAKKQRKQTSQLTVFSAVADAWHQFNTPKWAKSTADKCRACLDNDILPVLGEKLLEEISPADTASVIELSNGVARTALPKSYSDTPEAAIESLAEGYLGDPHCLMTAGPALYGPGTRVIARIDQIHLS